MRENVPSTEAFAATVGMNAGLAEKVILGRASARFEHRRPTRFTRDDKTGLMIPDPESFELIGVEEAKNLITDVGRDFLHVQGYGTAGILTNGLNYIALSNDAVTENAASTVLSNEIVANGLSRAQGVVAHTAGTNTSTIAKTFTATGAQSCQKAALFNLVAGGVMNHVLGFTQRSLITNDTLTATYTITLG